MAVTDAIPTEVETVAEFKISVEGIEIPYSIHLQGAYVSKIVNKISSAILVIQDGDAASGHFALTDGTLFLPGNQISIDAGDANSSKNIFTGIVIKQSIKIRVGMASLLTVECRHKAIKTTLGRNNAYFHNLSDSDILAEILSDAGFDDSDVESTSFVHKEMVQYNSTDWDFMLSRVEANGNVILTNNGSVLIKKPKVEDDIKLTLDYGINILELDAEMDSRNQFASVVAKAWSMADQEMVQTTANAPAALEEQGTLVARDLSAVAGPEASFLSHGGALDAQELQSWADAELLKSRLSKIRGTVKIQGNASIDPGDVIMLNGLGSHFNGKAFVSGVRQEYNGSIGWKTYIQFGNSPRWFLEGEENKAVAPKTGGLLPGVNGLHTGLVTDNEDPEGEDRVRVKMPFINADDDGVWARTSLADAGDQRGLFFRPEIGDEVVLGFLYDDPRQPIILGMLHSSNKPSPIAPTNHNDQKGYTSREKLAMMFDDKIKETSFTTPAGNKLFLSDDKKGFSVEDENGSRITTDPSNITIQDSNGNMIHMAINAGILNLKAITKVVVEAPQIELVDGATHPLVYGDALLSYLNQLVNIYATHMHPGETALGLPVTPAPPVPPMPPATPSLLSLKVKTG
ncbi:Rhs element Vgr protein [Pedobacter sp. UYEF25]